MSFLNWYGISAIQIQTNGRYIVVDPYLTKNPLGAVDIKNIVADIVLVSHGARDHFGDAVELALQNDAMLVGPVDVVTCAIERGVPEKKTKKMVPGGQRNILGIDIKPLHVQHISVTKWEGKSMTGVALSYIVTLEDGIKLYHAGDTALHGDFKLFGEVYKPDIGLMPVGMFPGASTEMNPMEAAIASTMMNFSLVIPIHYDPNTQQDYLEWFDREIKERNGDRMKVINMEAGARYEILNADKKLTLKKYNLERLQYQCN
jgi:L-ascorbate metabolism protein UlaG (beta-lactamase superfamily)